MRLLDVVRWYCWTSVFQFLCWLVGLMTTKFICSYCSKDRYGPFPAFMCSLFCFLFSFLIYLLLGGVGWKLVCVWALWWPLSVKRESAMLCWSSRTIYIKVEVEGVVALGVCWCSFCCSVNQSMLDCLVHPVHVCPGVVGVTGWLNW